MTSAAVVPIAGINVNRNVIQQDDHAITDHLEGAVDLHELIRAPNIVEQPNSDLARLIMNLVNTQGLAAKQSIIGTIIEPGRVGLILNNGRVEVCGTGRWIIPSPRASLARISSLSENPLTYESLTIVRVQKGAYGLARQNGKPIILGEGVHVYNDRLFQFVDFQVANQKEIHHGTIHILLVPIGEYALVEENNSPKILRAGRYVIDSNYFTVDKFVDVNSPHISHHTLHILRVPKGKVGLITNNNKPMLLAEGTFTFNVQVFTFDGIKDINEPLIRHGTITRFRVRNGEIGLAWDNNKPVFIDKPDFYEVDSPNFTFVNCVSATEKIIILGSCKRIIVNDGEVGISYVNGKLDILPPNTHVFNAVERIFQGFMSTKQEAIQLLEPGSKTNLLTCDTKDFVEVGIKAAVFYRISDPAQALLSVGDEKAITTLIRETSVATLQGIMRSSALNQVAQSKTVHVGHHATGGDGASGSSSPNPAAPPQPTSTVFFDKVHDEFIFKLYESFKKLYGIEISNIRIESFKIVNSELAENISKQAIITAQTETRLANLTSQREIATTEMERDAAVLRIQTQAAAQKLATETQANNSATISEAEAKASSLKIEAQGMAEALLVRAEAEAKAIELKAAAEKKRAQDLSSTNLGQQLAVLSAQSKMVSEALGGVEKVIYLSSGTNLGSAPLALFGLNEFEADGADVKPRRK